MFYVLSVICCSEGGMVLNGSTVAAPDWVGVKGGIKSPPVAPVPVTNGWKDVEGIE